MLPLKLLPFFLMILLLCVTSCGGEPVNGTIENSKALRTYPKARDVNTHKLNGTVQLEYWVDEAFPAPVVIDWVSQNLKDSGWEKLPGSYFNPQVGSVRSRDWVKIIDRRDSEESVVYQRSFDWKDAQNNIIVYGFEYTHPRHSQPTMRSMRVRAILTPAAIAKAQLDAGQKALKTLEGK